MTKDHKYLFTDIKKRGFHFEILSFNNSMNYQPNATSDQESSGTMPM